MRAGARVRLSAFCEATANGPTQLSFASATATASGSPFSLLGTWHFNPPEGLLLKFSGDLVYLVLIRGSALDKPLDDGNIDLIRAGLQRHRVLWVREMGEEDIRQTGDAGPTVNSIEMAGFASHEELKQWMEGHAASFLR